MALLVQAARIGAAQRGDEDAVLRSRKAQQGGRFRALVEARFRERVAIERYAHALGLNAGQLSRLCRELPGVSAPDVVNARVVHEARRELACSMLSIKQIAAVLGFEDEAYFGRFFKKHTGQRPTEFRAMAHQRLAAA